MTLQTARVSSESGGSVVRMAVSAAWGKEGGVGGAPPTEMDMVSTASSVCRIVVASPDESSIPRFSITCSYVVDMLCGGWESLREVLCGLPFTDQGEMGDER